MLIRVSYSFITAMLFVQGALLGFPSFASAEIGDYDADGLSDLSIVQVNRSHSGNSGSTVWITRRTNGSAPFVWSWNVPGDAFVTGRFFSGDPRYYPGIVWVRSAQLPLEWYIKNPAGQDLLIYYGLPGDTVPNQGDFDGDGVTDPCVIRVGSENNLFWFIALSGSGGQVVQLMFGVSGDRPFISDSDGDGRAEMIVLRPSTYVWYVLKPGESTFTQTQWGLPQDIPLAPLDLDGDHLTDFIITRRTGSFQMAYIRYGSGDTQTKSLGFDSSIPQLGNFVGTRGFSWAQRDTSWVAIQNADNSLQLFQFGIPSNAIVRADGTIVQPSDDGRFPVGGNGGGGGGVANCSVTYGSGWLFKPASQDSGGERQGRPLVLYSRNYPSGSCLNVLAINGEIISNYGKYSSNRFYEGWGCGRRHSAAQNAQLALSAAGSTNIYLHDPASGKCYGPAPADQRTDRR